MDMDREGGGRLRRCILVWRKRAGAPRPFNLITRVKRPLNAIRTEFQQDAGISNKHGYCPTVS